MPHVQLAERRTLFGSMGHSIDNGAAGSADALAAIAVELDRFCTAGDQFLVEDIEKLQEGHVCRDV